MHLETRHKYEARKMQLQKELEKVRIILSGLILGQFSRITEIRLFTVSPASPSHLYKTTLWFMVFIGTSGTSAEVAQ